MNKQQYKEYVQSNHWKAKRKEKLDSARWRCEKCGVSSNTNLQVHHLTYVRIGKECLSDLQVLCRNCHKATHDTGFVPRSAAKDKEISEKTAADLADGLGITIAEAREYLRKFGI